MAGVACFIQRKHCLLLAIGKRLSSQSVRCRYSLSRGSVAEMKQLSDACRSEVRLFFRHKTPSQKV